MERGQGQCTREALHTAHRSGTRGTGPYISDIHSNVNWSSTPDVPVPTVHLRHPFPFELGGGFSCTRNGNAGISLFSPADSHSQYLSMYGSTSLSVCSYSNSQNY